jgi:excisionase family DNA binding protein
MADDKLYSVEAAAEWLGGVSTWTVRSWLSQGRLRRVKVGRRTMIRQSQLETLIKDNAGSSEEPRQEAPIPNARKAAQ